MARNEEKHYCRLNRIILQKEQEEKERKNPKRPHLSTLSTAGEIKRWLPTIKRDIDFYLKQTQVWCYPERVIGEFNDRIDKLRREYQSYVRKLRELEPDLDFLPGTARGYSCKRTISNDLPNADEDDEESTVTTHGAVNEKQQIKRNSKKVRRIALPILDSDIERQYPPRSLKTEWKESNCLENDSTNSQKHDRETDRYKGSVPSYASEKISVIANETVKSDLIQQSLNLENQRDGSETDKDDNSQTSNPLGLDYSDSSEDETC